MLPPRLDDRGDHPVPGTQQGTYGHSPSNWPSRITASTVIPQCPLPAPFHPLLKAPVLLSFYPTCPDCCSTNHTVAQLFSCPAHPTDLAPCDMWTAPLQFAQFLAGPPLQIILTPFLHNFLSRGWLPPPWPPAGPHLPHFTLHPTLSHPWSGGHLPPPLINNVQQGVGHLCMDTPSCIHGVGR